MSVARCIILAGVALAGPAHAEHWEHAQTHLSAPIDNIDIAPNLNTCQDYANFPAMDVTTQLTVNGMRIDYGWEWACRGHQLYICPTQNCSPQFNEQFWPGDHWVRIDPPPVEHPEPTPQEGEAWRRAQDMTTYTPSSTWGEIPRTDPDWASLRDEPEEICRKLVNYPNLRTSGGFVYSCVRGGFQWAGDSTTMYGRQK